jgi:hypothetical protein
MGLADRDQIEEFPYLDTSLRMKFQKVIIFLVGVITSVLQTLPKSEMQGLAPAFLKREPALFYEQFLEKIKVLYG